MNWFYADNGQQRGPISEAEFDSLVAAGSIQPSTLVWHEGMPAWKPFAEARPVASPTGGPPPTPGETPAGAAAGGVVCSVCGKGFAEDQIIRFGPTIVCGGCKPVFLQRLREGATTPTNASAGTLSTAELLATDYETDIGGDLGRSWEIFKADAGTIIGASVLVGLCLFAGGIIPFIGPIIQIVLGGPLLGGLWLFFARKARGESPTIGDAFSGFGPKFLPLFLAYLIPILITIGVIAVVVGGMLLIGFSGAAATGASGSRAVVGLGMGAFIVVLVLAYLALIFLQICWGFALPLVIDKGLNFWPAMELSRKVVMKHFWWTLLLFIVIGLLTAVGALACLVGMVVTAPWAFGALAQHYNRVFGRLRQGG